MLALSREAAEGDTRQGIGLGGGGGLKGGGGGGWHHLQVEVSGSEDAWVQGRELDHYLLMHAQGPSLVTEQQATVGKTGILLYALEDVLGRHQEVDEVAEAVAAVAALHHVKHLAEHSGSGGLEGGVEGRQGALDAAVQRFRVPSTEMGLWSPTAAAVRPQAGAGLCALD